MPPYREGPRPVPAEQLTGDTEQAPTETNALPHLIEDLRRRFGENTNRDELVKSLSMSTDMERLVDETVKYVINRKTGTSITTESEGQRRAHELYMVGHVFDALAREHINSENHPYPLLEQFILEALRNNHLWDVRFENMEGFSTEDWDLYDRYIEARPKPSKYMSQKNNDAISMVIENDPTTGRPRAIITGVIEAKNHTPGSADKKQFRESRVALYHMIKRYKDILPLLVRNLGLADGNFPDEVDILDPEDLTYEFVLPKDVQVRPEKRKNYPGVKFTRIPVSTKEVYFITQAIVQEGRRIAEQLRPPVQESAPDAVN